MNNFDDQIEILDLNSPMEQGLNFNYILDTMSNNYGLAGIFANYGFGTTTLHSY